MLRSKKYPNLQRRARARRNPFLLSPDIKWNFSNKILHSLFTKCKVILSIADLESFIQALIKASDQNDTINSLVASNVATIILSGFHGVLEKKKKEDDDEQVALSS